MSGALAAPRGRSRLLAPRYAPIPRPLVGQFTGRSEANTMSIDDRDDNQNPAGRDPVQRGPGDDPPPFDPARDADAIHELRSILPPDPPPWATPMRFTTPEERAAGMPVAVPADE